MKFNVIEKLNHYMYKNYSIMYIISDSEVYHGYNAIYLI